MPRSKWTSFWGFEAQERLKDHRQRRTRCPQQHAQFAAAVALAAPREPAHPLPASGAEHLAHPSQPAPSTPVQRARSPSKEGMGSPMSTPVKEPYTLSTDVCWRESAHDLTSGGKGSVKKLLAENTRTPPPLFPPGFSKPQAK